MKIWGLIEGVIKNKNWFFFVFIVMDFLIFLLKNLNIVLMGKNKNIIKF